MVFGKCFSGICSLILCLLFAYGYSGCVAVEEATISGRSMSNGQIGYSGYEISVPVGYVSIQDPSLSDYGTAHLELIALADRGMYNVNQLLRDSHFFYNKENGRLIKIEVHELRGRVVPMSSLESYNYDRYYVSAKKHMFLGLDGQWERIKTEGSVSFVKTGTLLESGQAASFCCVYGQYKEGFFIEGYTREASSGGIRHDVIQTAHSLEL